MYFVVAAYFAIWFLPAMHPCARRAQQWMNPSIGIICLLYLRMQVAKQVIAHFFPLLRLPRRRSTPAVRLAPLLARQLQHAGPADGELEDVPVRAQEPAQEEQPMAAGELFS